MRKLSQKCKKQESGGKSEGEGQERRKPWMRKSQHRRLGFWQPDFCFHQSALMDSRCLLGKPPCCSHWKVMRGKPIFSLTGLWLHALGPSYSLPLLILSLRLQFKRGKGLRSRCKELHLEPRRQGLRQAPRCILVHRATKLTGSFQGDTAFSFFHLLI